MLFFKGWKQENYGHLSENTALRMIFPSPQGWKAQDTPGSCDSTPGGS